MSREWLDLTNLTRGEPIVVERVLMLDQDIAIEGSFDLPPLAQLSMEDQIFVAAFVRAHGSIKQMESLFGVSYPTVKNRLNRIAKKFDFLKIVAGPDQTEILQKLDRGEITVGVALEMLEK